MVLITHDLGVVAGIADRVLVMYAGKPVEIGEVDDIYYHPRMPYTKGLLNSIPRLDDPSGEDLRAHPGRAAVAGQPAAGLPVRAPLPLPDRHLRRGGAAAAAGRRSSTTGPPATSPTSCAHEDPTTLEPHDLPEAARSGQHREVRAQPKGRAADGRRPRSRRRRRRPHRRSRC